MPYVDGYLVPVPGDNVDRYKSFAQEWAPRFKQWGATRVVEALEDDCPPGKRNDFHTAVLSEEGEKTVFSWVEWPDKTTRDEGWAKMQAFMDQAGTPPDMPFDGARMIFGGFMPFVDE